MPTNPRTLRLRVVVVINSRRRETKKQNSLQSIASNSLPITPPTWEGDSQTEIYKIDAETLGIYVSLIANFRNICAHEDILYDYRTQRRIPDTKYHEVLGIDKLEDEYRYGKNDLFALIIILKQMLSLEEFHDLIGEISYEVDYLDGIVDTVSLNSILNRIGFPDNWRDIVDID